MFCKNCGNSVQDGTVTCPYCGSALEQSQPQYQQPTYQQPQYQQPAYQQPGYQQPYQQPYQPVNPEVSTAKTLGIVAIVAAFFIPLVSFICGGIGLSKANQALAFNPGDFEAANAKKLNKIGLILAGVLVGLAVLIYIVLFAVLMANY